MRSIRRLSKASLWNDSVLNYALLTCALLLAACSPVQTLNALIPDRGYVLQQDLVYGDPATDQTRHKLDLYLPKASASQMSAKLPVVIFFYGGSWDSGDKKDYKFVGEALSSQGYVTVIPDYRVYPEVGYPAFLEDAANAVAWVRQHIDEYGGDANRIVLGGHSAGAYIAVMLSLNSTYLQQAGLQASDIAGTFGLAGPYDFLPLRSARLKTIFGDDEQQQAAQPIRYASADSPPMLLLVGDKDGTVSPGNSRRLAEKLMRSGARVQLEQFETFGHVDMVAKLAKPLRGDGLLLNSIVRFVSQVTHPRQSAATHQKNTQE